MIILIIGLPRAGKTTFSATYNNVLHLDDFEPNKFSKCNEAVSRETGDVVVEGIYNLTCRRAKLLEAYRGTGKRICIWLDTPLEECLKRKGRGRETILMGARQFQPPTLAEGWDEIRVVRNGKEEVMEK